MKRSSPQHSQPEYFVTPTVAPHGKLLFHKLHFSGRYEDFHCHVGTHLHTSISDPGVSQHPCPLPTAPPAQLSFLTCFKMSNIPTLPAQNVHLPVPKALTLSTATWLQAPGAAPQSRTQSPGRRIRCLSSISSNLKALRQR